VVHRDCHDAFGVTANAGATDWKLTAEELAEIKQLF